MLKCVTHPQVEDEESVQGKFYNDLYCLELDKGRWHQLLLRYVYRYICKLCKICNWFAMFVYLMCVQG